MKIRKLTRETLQKYLVYFPESGLFVRRVDSRKARAGDIAGYIDPAGYCYIRICSIKYAAHQLAWLYTHGEYLIDELDHINGVKHDNRISNLRPANRSQNMANQGIAGHNTSGFKGVCYDKANDKWMAYIVQNRKFKNLGRYDTAEKAALAYDKAAKDTFTEFAHVNSEIFITTKRK